MAAVPFAAYLRALQETATSSDVAINKRYADITNKLFGDLLAIKPLGCLYKAGKTMYWRCYCTACGRYTSVRRSDLISGKRKSCGYCYRAAVRESLVSGSICGRVQLIYKFSKPTLSRTRTVWRCRCLDCSKIIDINDDNLRVRKGGCGCL